MKRRFSPPLLFALAAFISVASQTSDSFSEKKGKATNATQVVTYATPLKAQPGEASKTLADLEVGTSVEVMGRKGRWVRVRARTSGKLGWVTRTTIGAAEEKEDGWGGDQIGVDGAQKNTEGKAVEVFAVRRTKARNRPSKKGDRVFTVSRSARLLVTDRQGTKWLQVKGGNGSVGWIRSSAVETASGQPLSTELEDPSESDDGGQLTDAELEELSAQEEAGSAGPDRVQIRLSKRGLEIAAEATIGLSSYSRTFSSNGEGTLGGYRISAGAMAVSSAALVRKHLGKVFFGGRGGFSTHIGAPGIRFLNEEGEVSEPNGFQMHQLGVAFEAGATLNESHPVRVSALAGYRLGYFVVSKIQDNPGLLAREKLAGLKLGTNVSTGVSKEILIAAEFYWTPSASLAQTENLEDGMDSEVWAIGGGARASYLLDSRHTIEIGYFGRRVKYRFSGQSSRQFDVTSARRKDLTHSLMVGAARAF